MRLKDTGDGVWQVHATLQPVGGFLQEIKGYSEDSEQ